MKPNGRILVTGGAGFIGSHLCHRLLERGHEVICIDNFYTGSKQNLGDLLSHPKFELIRHDVNFPLYIEVDQIYNLACPASPIHYQKDPVQTVKTSIIGATNMLGIAKRLRIPILQASTSEVYGDPEVHPQTEDYWGSVNPIGLRSCYDEGKRCAETLFSDYRRQHNWDTKIIRIFNTYGLNMQPEDGRVVSNFILQALHNAQRRYHSLWRWPANSEFLLCRGLVEGMIRMMNSDYPCAGSINLGNPNEITIKELAEKIIQITSSQAKLIFQALPQDDPKRRKPDISKAKAALNWEPQVALEDGLKRTVAYFEVL